MNALLEIAVVWLLWTGVWWVVLAVGVALWFGVKPPQAAAVRHAALASAIVAGTLAGLIPRWGSGVVSLRETVVATPKDTTPEPTEPIEPTALKGTSPTAFPGPVPAPRDVHPATPATTSPTRAMTTATQRRDWFALGQNLMIAAWVLGALFLSVRLIRAARMTLRWRNEAQPLPDDERAVFVALKRELGVRRATNTGSHSEPASPVVLCGWPPLILVPEDWSTWEPESRSAAWRHELAHVRRRDDWWRVLSEGLRVLLWFHPGMRWLLSRRELEAELLSDEAAVAAGCPPRELAQVLIDACRRPQSAAWMAPAGMFFSPRTMKQRIVRLLDAPSAEALCRPAPRGLRLVAFAGMALLALAGSMRWIAAANPAKPVDLTSLERRIAKEPKYQSKHPIYCLLAFGKNAEPRWLVLDIVTEPSTNGPGENVAYLDRDGDSDLTRPGNRIVGKIVHAGTEVVTFAADQPRVRYKAQFDFGDVVLADGTKHTKFTLEVGDYVQDYRQVAFRLLLRGQHDQLVAYAPGASLLRFGDSPTDAPVVHLDGPLTFRNYASDGRLSIPTCPFPRGTPEGREWCEANPPTYGVEKLRPGEKFDIQAELGTLGLGRGTFAKLSRNMPPEDVHPHAELMLPGGKTLSVALTLRHATTMFSGAVLIPKGTPPGKATVTLSFTDWADGKVQPATDEIEVGVANEEPRVPRLEPDRKARVGELLGVQIAAYPVVPRGGDPTTVEKDGTIRVADLPPIAVAGKTAEEIEGLILETLGELREPDTHVAVCFLRAAADVPDPPAEEAEPVKKRPNYVTVVGKLLDDETGEPIEKAGWEWGMADPKNPEQIAWGHSRSMGGNYPGGKFEMLVHIGANGHHYPLRVYSAGYETTMVVDQLAKPYPEKIERTVRMKRGRGITGVLRDHTGKPVANGWVFFIPKGHPTNIVEGVPGTDAHQLPDTGRDGAVAEVRTNANGTFALSTGADGTLAASTDLVDLWPFPLPEDGYAELKMPAPSYLVIDLTYWYLDEFGKKGKRAVSPYSEDPNQCWIQVDQSGSAEPLWKNLGYRRQMLVFAKDPRVKLSKGVTVEHVIEGEMDQPIPDVGHNKNLSTKIRIALPPGSYRVQRLRAGPFAPVGEQQVTLNSGEEHVVSWARGDGSSVRGEATWPANMMFVRQQGEAPRKLDWTVPDLATVRIAPAVGNGKPIEAAKIQSDGSFFVATNLDPGKYKATAQVYLPEGDFRGGLRVSDCEFSQEFTVPDPLRGPAGSPPVEVEIKMNVSTNGRFVPAEAQETQN